MVRVDSTAIQCPFMGIICCARRLALSISRSSLTVTYLKPMRPPPMIRWVAIWISSTTLNCPGKFLSSCTKTSLRIVDWLARMGSERLTDDATVLGMFFLSVSEAVAVGEARGDRAIPVVGANHSTETDGHGSLVLGLMDGFALREGDEGTGVCLGLTRETDLFRKLVAHVEDGKDGESD